MYSLVGQTNIFRHEDVKLNNVHLMISHGIVDKNNLPNALKMYTPGTAISLD